MYRYAKRRFGEVPEPFAVTAHHPRLLVANAVHETMLQWASRRLPANVRELAVFWTARTIGCSWCVDFGSMLQRLDGLDVKRLADIENYATSPRFTDDERAAVAYADAMTIDPHSVSFDEPVDGKRQLRIEVALVAYDREGTRVNYIDRSIAMSFTPAQLAGILADGIRVRMALDVPAGSGSLRIGVQDLATARAGSLEVATPSGGK